MSILQIKSQTAYRYNGVHLKLRLVIILSDNKIFNICKRYNVLQIKNKMYRMTSFTL